MKAFAILPSVAAAVLAFNVSAASSQGACMQEYQACMDACASRSAKTFQGNCFSSCEGTNNVCSERVYGKRPNGGLSSAPVAQQPQAKEALAKTENKTEKEPPQPQATEPGKAPAPEQRAPARRQAR